MNFSKLIIGNIIKIAATRCQKKFKAKMHQVRLQLQLHPKPQGEALVSLQCSPRPSSRI